MTAGSKTCISVSTLSEAEFYASAGYDDITYAYPLSPDKIPQASQLLSRLEKFHVLIDNLVVLKSLVNNPPKEGKKWSVFLKVDCGYNRAGVSYNDPKSVELAKEICSKSCVDFQGLYMHEGNAYGCKDEADIKETTAEATKRLVIFHNKLKEAGINCPVVTIGSTPSCSKPPEDISGVTEFHPGNYVFYDYQQSLIGSCDLSDIAVRILTRVIGTYPDRGQILIDCGWTGLSLDSLGKLKTGYCFFEGHPDLKLVKMTQEIGTVEAVEGFLDVSAYPIGSHLKIIPYHSCASAFMHPVYYVVNGDTVIDKWIPNKGW
ncbi:D-threo-3-hydroxyaspartate dehydratase-like isoform X3 [Acropora millepora]|nr:D-threo-3-hydroxyaspartate dehydratase-like isoform X3 [Acropora millepora]XP_044183354.1 D-threo-3-hydroxyaspartate dehydratase-like isoform X3 [Acropora millepora]